MSKDMNRREAVGRVVKLCGAAALTAGAYGLLYGRAPLQAGQTNKNLTGRFKLKDGPDEVVVAVAKNNFSAEALVRGAIEKLGGISRFVSPGDVVAIKPNMSWDSPPELAANTNPEIVSAMIKMCLDAGASKINLVDHTINDPRRVFLTSGMEAVARETGARLKYPESRDFKTLPINGMRLNEWKVFIPVIEADKLINMPVAKNHGLTRLSMGMKNWIGAVGGSRGTLHQDINQSIVDLAFFFQPTLVVMDATRIMVKNGPSGGRLADVEVKNTVIAGTDQVAVDAAAVPLFNLFPDEIGYLLLAEKQGLGKIDPGPEKLLEIMV